MRFLTTPIQVVGIERPGFLSLSCASPDWGHLLVTAVRPLTVLTWSVETGSLLEGQRPDGDWWRFSTIGLTADDFDRVAAHVESNGPPPLL